MWGHTLALTRHGCRWVLLHQTHEHTLVDGLDPHAHLAVTVLAKRHLQRKTIQRYVKSNLAEDKETILYFPFNQSNKLKARADHGY